MHRGEIMDKRIVEFLIRAKKATYAGKGAETASSRPESHDLIYREDDLMYYDTYLGGNKFAGEEALWISDKPYWSMNYAGRVTGSPFSGDFLKEALLRVPESHPFRGPESYENGDYVYLETPDLKTMKKLLVKHLPQKEMIPEGGKRK